MADNTHVQADDGTSYEDGDGQGGLPGRAGWFAVLQVEEQRTRRHGGSHALVLIRLEGPADSRLAELAARAVSGVIRDIDFLAQPDHQTFAVLALHCADLPALVDRLRAALDTAGVWRTALIDARPAGGELGATWAAMTSPVPATPRIRHVEFVPTRPSLN